MQVTRSFDDWDVAGNVLLLQKCAEYSLPSIPWNRWNHYEQMVIEFSIVLIRG